MRLQLRLPRLNRRQRRFDTVLDGRRCLSVLSPIAGERPALPQVLQATQGFTQASGALNQFSQFVRYLLMRSLPEQMLGVQGRKWRLVTEDC